MMSIVDTLALSRRYELLCLRLRATNVHVRSRRLRQEGAVWEGVEAD